MAKHIQTADGTQFLVDDEDYEKLGGYNWHCEGAGKRYAYRSVRSYWVDGKRKREKSALHREIVGLYSGDPGISDHIDRNFYDCRKSNLRITGFSGSVQNTGPQKCKTKSIHKGVTYCKGDTVWRANMNIDGKIVVLGKYNTEREAALCYDFHARKRYAEFAYLNFPDEVLSEPPLSLTRIARKPRKGKQFKGTCQHEHKWVAGLTGPDKKYHRLGRFPTEEDAARAYDRAAYELFGPGCYLNFPDEIEK